MYKEDNNGQKVLIVDRYEFLVYRLLRNGLEAGDIFCLDSARFRSFEDDLLDDHQWQQKEKLIAEAGLTILNKPILNHLVELENKLETRIIEVNQRIASGANEHLKIKKRGLNRHWTLPYVSEPESTNHSFFGALKQVDIGSVLNYVNQPSHYGDILIKPVRKINTDLIVEEWDNIQRIILSLALKSTTQNIIIGKLSAYARKNKTKSALWEYDNILKSLYFLDYIDSLPLRRNVQRALNRGESYHKLRRAVSHANLGKLRFKTKQEQQIWGECSRLLANCIIYYNASILSNMLDYRESNGKDLDVLKHISPVAWQHINLYGRYEFNKNPEPINMDIIIQELAQFQVLPD